MNNAKTQSNDKAQRIYYMNILSNLIRVVLVINLLILSVTAQKKEKSQPQQQQPEPAKKPIVVERKSIPIANRPNLSLQDVNTIIGIDQRVIIMQAALNMAGYDYEPSGRALSPLRARLREDLQNVEPNILAKLRAHFSSHKEGKTAPVADASYLSLAVSMNAPPAFTIDEQRDRLPEDVQRIADFAIIEEEFYGKGFSKLLPKYTEDYTKAAQSYGNAAGVAIGTVLNYLHTEPILELPPYPAALRAAQEANRERVKKKLKPEFPSNRIRQFVIAPDLLNATSAANLRIVRDTYYLLLGPSSIPNVEAIRRGYITFIVEPLTDSLVKEVAAIGAPLRQLMESRGKNLDTEYAKRNAYYLITDSFVRAVDTRMDVLGLAALGQISEDEAIYRLSQAYDRGAVLVFHFYDQIKAAEKVGVNIQDYYASLLANINFEKEAKRLDVYADRIAKHKASRAEVSAGLSEKISAQVIQADNLLKAKKYDEAGAILISALKEDRQNARVLYGIAEVTSKKAAAIEDADIVEEMLYAAVEYYRQAAMNATDSEKWLAQRSYVNAAKILDFIASNNPNLSEKLSVDAKAAYELAFKMGKIEGGAFEEAEKALTQKPKEN